MSKKFGQIVGEVKYREGDGMELLIPTGPVEIVQTRMDATLSWEEGDTRGVAALPLADFQRFVSTGAIEVGEEIEADDPALVQTAA